MTGRSALALGAVIAVALAAGFALTSIDRRADEIIKVPTVALPTENAHELATELPPPGKNSAFLDDTPGPPPPNLDALPSRDSGVPNILLTVPPQQKIDGKYVVVP